MNPSDPDLPIPSLLPTVENPPWQRARLARWCAEWELHCALRADVTSGADDGDVPASGSVPASPPPGLVAPFDTADVGFRAGAIRLLAHDQTKPDCRPLFVLILGPKGESESELWIAPFGPFLEPASPGEWQTGEEDPDFAVLSLWNARLVTRESLARSWHTGALDAEQVTDALAILRHTLLGDRLPARLRAQVGPPINSLDDPRCAYQAEEMGIFTAFDAQMLEELEAETEGDENEIPQGPKSEDQVTPTEEKEIEDFLYAISYLQELEELEESEELAGHADTSKALSFEALFFAPQHGVFLSATPAGKDIAFLVLDEHGDRSTALDGASILGADGRAIATISDARAATPRDALTAGFRLIDRDGKAVRMEPTSRDDTAS